jgi:dihydrofolate reductase
MARAVYYAACSLDGYIADPDDGIDWLTGYQGSFDDPAAEPMEGSYDRFYEGVGALVMGSVTYRWLLEHVETWPYSGEPVWVLSSRDLPRPEGEDVDVRVVEAPVTALYDEMTEAAGERDLWVVGGGNVASQFTDEGLLDELIVTLVPVVLGEGKPLFDRRLPGGPMRLLGARSFDTGMVELRYAVER